MKTPPRARLGSTRRDPRQQVANWATFFLEKCTGENPGAHGKEEFPIRIDGQRPLAYLSQQDVGTRDRMSQTWLDLGLVEITRFTTNQSSLKRYDPAERL